ncbi:NirD/YgiW/YdeI family stress tolerance protein [Vibrio sp. 10N.247.311.51]|uniref:NirD/YgiW/YdeI family stress tolerance protein n=1 Tax=Vibrio sp. 10N.247.311.51 TaxID=3229996 RepID=UPI003552B463
MLIFIVFFIAKSMMSELDRRSNEYRYYLTTANDIIDSDLLIDGLPVALVGKIVEYHGDDIYTFRDETGYINVEIEYDNWMMQASTTQSIVEVNGEVDKSFIGIRVDVDFIKNQ